MARVVPQLVDKRGDQLGQAIVLLQIDREVGFGLAADFGECLGVLAAVDGDANDVGPRLNEIVDLPRGGVDIRRLGRRHALHGDGPAGPNLNRPDADRSGFSGGSSATIVSVSAIGNWLLRRSGLGQLMGPGLVLKFIT